jgi:hypothetical protein
MPSRSIFDVHAMPVLLAYAFSIQGQKEPIATDAVGLVVLLYNSFAFPSSGITGEP